METSSTSQPESELDPKIALETVALTVSGDTAQVVRLQDWDSLEEQACLDRLASSLFDAEREAHLGRYILEEPLARGGFGVVYRARDPELDRDVAIKVLRVGARHSTEDLLVEARTVARLEHPNVVRVYDVGVVDSAAETEGDGAQDGPVAYVVMELIEGETLADWLTEPRSRREILRVFRQAGQGLIAAHRAGVVHRDFKPANVLIDGEGVARVLDFGLATHVAQRPADEATGWVVGTPAYMAPEQHRAEATDPRSDQFSFALALAEALLERRLPGETLEEIRHRVSSPALSAEVRRSVRGRLGAALGRALAPDRADRHPSLDELVALLDEDPNRVRNRWLAGISIVVALGGGASGFAAWSQARAERCSGAAGRLAGIWDDARRDEVEAAIGRTDAPYAPKVWERTASELDRYAADWVSMHTEACEATTVRGEQSEAVMDLRMGCLHRAKVDLDAVVGVLASADAEVTQKAHEVIGGLPSLQRCADVEGLQVEVEPPRQGDADAVEAVRARLAAAKAERSAGRYEEARETMEEAHRAMEGLQYAPLQAEYFLTQGRVLLSRGEYDEAARSLEQALEFSGRAHRWELLAEAATELLFVVGIRQGKPEEGLRFAALARGLIGRPEAEAALANNVAGVLYAKREYEEAEAQARRALQLREETLGPDDPDVAPSRMGLALVLEAQGKHEESLQQHRRGLALLEKTLGPDHPSTAVARDNLAGVLFSQRNYDAAEQEYRAALAVKEATLGSDHPSVAGSRNNLGAVLQAQEKYDEAEAEFRASLAVKEARLGPAHPDVIGSRNNLASVLYSAGKNDVAEAEFRRSLATAIETLGPEHPHVAQAHYALARLLLERGANAEALQFAELAWQRRQRDDVPPHRRANAAFVFAKALWETGGDRNRARTLAQEALDDYRKAGEAEQARAAEIETWLATH